MKVNAIITGSTGMVGEGVLHVCLESPRVEKVLVINRKPCGVQHPKLKELIHKDFSEFDSVANELKGYNAAFLCMGITSVGASEELYTKITYEYTLALARTLVKLGPDSTVCYVSGAGTKQEGAKGMWIRVKGRTERELQALGKNMYMFRPGYIRPMDGMKNTYKMYRALDWLFFPLLKLLAPKVACTLKEIGLAMVNCASDGHHKKILEVPDIEQAALIPYSEIYRRVSGVDGIAGMTTNERLWESHLMKDFDQCRKKDKEKARKILEMLKVDQPSIQRIVP